MTTTRSAGRSVPVPADITQPDKFLFRLTLRQTCILAATALLLGLAWRLLHNALPGWMLLVGAVPVAAIAAAVAVGRRDGLPLDRWLRHALTALRAPKRLATHGIGDGVAVLRL